MDSSITIIGPGAVGLMLTYFLQRIAPVYLRGRHGPKGLSFNVQHRRRIQTVIVPEKSAPSALWIVATKAYDLEGALKDALPGIPHGATIVLLANGYLEPTLRDLRTEALPQNLVWTKGLVARGCRFLDDGTLALSDTGAVLWGHAGKPLELENKIFADLTNEDFAWDPEACTRRREKWIFNAVLNTLCGAHRLPRNGLAPSRPDFEPLLREVFGLARRLWSDWNFSDKSLRNDLLRLIEITRDNENSMARDLRLHRPSEADFLSGHVLSVPNGAAEFPLLASLHREIVSANA